MFLIIKKLDRDQHIYNRLPLLTVEKADFIAQETEEDFVILKNRYGTKRSCNSEELKDYFNKYIQTYETSKGIKREEQESEESPNFVAEGGGK
jgi:(p)ppGpp synthase/HD superfamily hydrolase